MRTLIPTLIACLCITSAQAQYGGGSGEPDDPYRIETAEQMNAIGAHPDHWSRHFRLVADIDLGDEALGEFNFIGTYEPFTGVFDGNDHSISNFHFDDTDVSRLWRGLFCIVADPNAEIRDLKLIDPNVSGIANVGPLVGWLWEGAITNCHVIGGSVDGTVVETPINIGGLVGSVASGTIRGCTSSSRVIGDIHVGGLIGRSGDCAIQDCCATGDVTGEFHVGGLAGTSLGSITRSCATGQVVGRGDVGGLAGSCSGAVTNCYATGSVTSEWWTGGLIGSYWAASIANCYATGEVIDWPDDFDSPSCTPGGLLGMSGDEALTCFWDVETGGRTNSEGGIGLTTVEMQTASTFLEAGWDFADESENGTDDIWWIDEGQDYPRLWWERIEQP